MTSRNAIGPERWLPAPSMADETEAWRAELAREAKAEFGLRDYELDYVRGTIRDLDNALPMKERK